MEGRMVFWALLVGLMLLPGVFAEDVHDVRVGNVTAYGSPVIKGHTAEIEYLLTNEGTANESVFVTIRDSTDNITICTGTFSVAPGQTLVRSCLWNTTSDTTVGDHMVTVVADPVPGETDVADNANSIIVAVIEQVHDVAVNSIAAPGSAALGAIVPVDVYIGNEGNEHEYGVQVVLEDLTDGVTIDTKIVDVYLWDTNKKVSYSWNTAGRSVGNHTLKATAGPLAGETDTADNTKTRVITLVDNPPVADAGLDQSVETGQSVVFDGSGSTDDYGISLYEWDFESDGTYDASGVSSSHVYGVAGTYTVTLRVTDTIGQTDTDTAIVTATAPPVHDVAVGGLIAVPNPAIRGSYVVINYSLTNEGTADETVTVTINDSTDGVNLCTDVLSVAPSQTLFGEYCAWNTSAASVGNHTITVSAEPVPGETDTADNVGTVILTVSNPPDNPPVADAGPDKSAYLGDAVYFNGSGSTDDYGISLYEWDFESDGTYDASGVSASHVYWFAGIYTATLRVTDTSGQTDTDTATVNASEPPVYNGSISSLTTDKPKYLRGQTVYSTAVVANTGNQVLNAQVKFTYMKPDGSTAFTDTKSVSVPVGGSVNSQSSYTLPSNAQFGTWSVRAELIYNSQTLDTKTTTFQVARKL